jgi:hypothetical protein
MSRRADVAVRATTAGVAALLGAANPALGVGAAVAKEVVDPVLARVVSTVAGAGVRSVRRVLGMACDETGLDEDQLLNRVGQAPNGMLLAGEIFEASARTTVPDKLAAFGRLLANAAMDGSTVDTDRLFVALLVSLEEPHIRLLNLLVATPPRVKVQGFDVTLRGWRPDQIADADPGLAAAVEMLVPTLRAEGLVEDVGSVVSDHGVRVHDHQWALTSLGRAVLERLAALAAGP